MGRKGAFVPQIGFAVTKSSSKSPVEVLVVAVPETAGSALYGMVDVLLAAGNIWQTLMRRESQETPFQVRIVAPTREAFACGNRIPVMPDCAVTEDPMAGIVILPELWLGPDEDIRGRYPELMEWIRRIYKAGAALYSACSGAVMLAETGLLDGCDATSHWGYQDLFRQRYPEVRFQPEPNLVFADAIKRVVEMTNIPERTLKRRFKAATGWTLIDYLQNLRIEEAKRLLESGHMPVDEISVYVSYEDASFFRRLFKRRTGLTPGQYRRMFQPILGASGQT